MLLWKKLPLSERSSITPRNNTQLPNGIGNSSLTNYTLFKLEKKLLTEPQLLPLLKDHFLITMLTMELTTLEEELILETETETEVEVELPLLISEVVMPRPIQSFQEHQKLFQLMLEGTLYLQDIALSTDHVHLLVNALPEITSTTTVIL